MKKLTKLILIPILVILILTFSFVIFILPGLISSKLDNELNQTFQGYYQLSFENTHSNITWQGVDIVFDDVMLKTDTSVLNLSNRFPITFFEAKEFSIRGIKVFKLLTGKELNIKKVLLSQPEVTVIVPEKYNTTDSLVNKENSKADYTEYLTDLFVDDFEIADGKVSMVFLKKPKDTIKVGEQVNFHLEEVDLNLDTKEYIISTSSIKQVQFSMEKLNITPLDTDIEYSIGHLEFDYLKGVFMATDLRITPLIDMREISKQTDFRKTITQLHVASLNCTSNKFSTIKTLKSFEVDSIHLKDVTAKMFKNRNKPLSSATKRLLHEELKALPIKLKVDHILIENGNMELQILTSNVKPPAQLFINDLDVSLEQINTLAVSSEPMRIQATGKFMKDAQFKLNSSLPLSGTSLKHNYTLNLGPMKFTSLNPLISRLSKIDLAEGTIQSIIYKGSMGKFKHTGSITPVYNDMKLTITDSDNDKKWFSSGVANLLIRNNNKTSKTGTSEPFNFSYARPLNKDHSDLLTGGLFNGLAIALLPSLAYKAIALPEN